MNTTTPTQALLRRIRKALAAGSGDEELASEFAELCRDANSRMDECEELAHKGSAEKAVKVAEEAPALIELLEPLSGFDQVDEWAACCRQGELPVAEHIDANALQRLLAIYKKWKGCTKFLWKRYRDAVIRKDEVLALGIARRILKTDPTDRSAREEANRILRRHFRNMLRELDELVDCVRRPAAIALADGLDGLPFDDLKKGKSWSSAIAWRDAQRRAFDEKRLAALVAGFAAQREARDLEGVRRCVAEARKIIKTHKFEIDDNTRDTLKGAGAWIGEEEGRRELEAGAHEALARCEKEFSKTSGNWASLIKGPIREIDGASRRLTNCWKEVEKTGGGGRVDLTKVTKLSDELVVMAKKRRARRMRKIRTTISVIVLIAFSVAYYFYAQWRGDVILEQMATYKKERTAIPLKKLTRSMNTYRWPIKKLARLDVRVAGSQSWLKREYDHYDAVGARIVALDEETAESFDRPIDEYYEEVEDIKVKASEAAADLQPLLEKRMAGFKSRYDAHVDDYVTEQRRRRVDVFAGIKKLTNSMPRLDIAARDDAKLAEVSELSEELEDAMRTVIPPAAPTNQVEIEAADLGPQVNSILRRLKEFREVLAEADAAEDFGKYQLALMRFRDGEFEGTPERTAAAALLAFEKTESKEIGEILAPDDQKGWVYFDANRDKPELFPNKVEEKERRKLEEISAERELDDLYRCYFKDLQTGESFVSYCVRPTKLRNRRVGPTAIVERSGRFYDEGGVSFRKYEVKDGKGIRMIGEGPAAETALLRQINPSEKLMSGSQQYYRTSVFETFDQILAARDAHPMFKAYLQLELGMVVAKRPDAWGSVFAPQLFADLRRLKAAAPALLNRTSWMWTGKYPKQEQALRAIYRERDGHRYALEARANRQLIEETLKTGFGYAGYVGVDGQLVLRPGAEAADVLYGAPKPGALSKVVYRKSGEADGAGDLLGGSPAPGWAALERVAPLTPLLFFKGDREELIQSVATAEGVSVERIRSVALAFFLDGIEVQAEPEEEGTDPAPQPDIGNPFEGF